MSVAEPGNSKVTVTRQFVDRERMLPIDTALLDGR